MFKKILNCRGSSGSNGWACKARANAYCTANDIFYSGHLRHTIFLWLKTGTLQNNEP